jgi:hypothetical protein
MIITKEMDMVINYIRASKIHPDIVSPNMVADISYSMGLSLSSSEINYISSSL